MPRRHRARDNFSKRPQLFIHIKRLHGDKDVKSRRARSFHKTHNPQFFQFIVQRPRNRYHHGKLRPVRRIQIKKEVIGMFEIIQPAGPRIVVNAT